MSTHGRYVMLRKIADGGMAEIFLAKQTGEEGFSRMVVVKRILPAYSNDPHFRDMLLDEAHIAMTLNHSNVVPVLDLGRAEGSYFLVMELVDGWDLGQVFDRSVRASFNLPLGLALYVVAEVCRGLGYAHSRRSAEGKPLAIVHRDVSPQNVLISEHGEVKVTDFGIAKALGRRDRTQTGMIKGKLDFMSPEQASGESIDASSDIFAAGTMLYLLCTGLRPFASMSDMEALARVQRADFAAPEDVRPGLSPAVSRIVKKAMRARPGDRYASADEMMLDLEAVVRQEFGSPGQSQLKRWLAELTARDGGVPLSRRPAMEAGPSLTSQWFAEGEMLSFDDSSKISTGMANHSQPRNPTSHISSYSTEAPRVASPRPVQAAGYLQPGGYAQAKGMSQASNFPPPGRRMPSWMSRSMMSRPMAMMRPRPRPPMMGMTDPGMEIARHRRPLLKLTVVLILLGGGGALAASQILPPEQQKQLQADARGMLRRGAEQISAVIERWKASRAETAGEKPVGVERAGSLAPGARPAGRTGERTADRTEAERTRPRKTKDIKPESP